MRLLALLCLVPCAASLHVLLYVNVIGKSHLLFADNLIGLLRSHNHTVDLVLGMFNSLVDFNGDRDVRQQVTVSFPGEKSPWSKDAEHLKSPFEETTAWNPFDNGNTAFMETSIQLCDLLLDSVDVDSLLSSTRYDIALITAYDFCPFGIAYQYNITKVASLVPTAATTLQTYYSGTPELPLYDNSFLSTRDAGSARFSERLFEGLRVIHDRLIDYKGRSRVNAKFRSRFGDSFPDVGEILKNVSLDFTNSHPLLEEQRPLAPRIRFIGGIAQPTPRPLDKKYERILNASKGGCVVFSFGTQISSDKFSEQFIETLVETFKAFPEYTFLVKLDGKRELNAANAHNVEWLPQTDLLYDSRVVAFISHMGLNSFTEASFAGVPFVAIPFFVDQKRNAQRAVSLGTGVVVSKTAITAANLKSALRQVLFDDGYRKRARELASMIAATNSTPQRVFLEGIELAAKFEGLGAHYRLIGADYSIVIQNGWDVAACLTLCCLFASYLALKAIAFAYRNSIARIFIVKKKAD